LTKGLKVNERNSAAIYSNLTATCRLELLSFLATARIGNLTKVLRKILVNPGTPSFEGRRSEVLDGSFDRRRFVLYESDDFITFTAARASEKSLIVGGRLSHVFSFRARQLISNKYINYLKW
jgi:hypothetical protein